MRHGGAPLYCPVDWRTPEVDGRALALRISRPKQRDLMRPAQGARRDAFLRRIGTRPLLMGIVNVTPDSFSDGGQFFNTSDALERAKRLAAEGADIVDVGGESTRPGATPLSVEDELARIDPVLAALDGALDVPVS